MSRLVERKCRELPAGTTALDAGQIKLLLADVPGWAVEPDGKRIAKTYEFSNFHETMEFVNALAWVVHRQDHHPDLEVSYKRCRVVYWTHTVGGLSENDFVCAARIEALIGP